MEVPTTLGDDIDHGKKRVAAVEGGHRAATDLNAFNEIDVNREFGPDHGFVIDVVVEPMPVHKQQDSRVVVPGAREAPNTQTAIVSVIGDKESSSRPQNIGQSSVPVLLDFRSGYHGDRRRGILSGLEVPGSTVDLNIAQLFEGYFQDIRNRLLRYAL
jgi:hypothetical protein